MQTWGRAQITRGLPSGKLFPCSKNVSGLIHIDSWNLAAAIMVSVGGRLSDLFGRRYFFAAAPAISCIGALVGATSHSIGQSIASGVIFGFGGGLGEMSLGVVQEIVPNRWRVQMLGEFWWDMLAAALLTLYPSGICDSSTTISAFGPLMAYAFIAHTSIKWRAVYWFCFGVELFAFVMVILFYRPPTFKTKHGHEGISKVDLLKRFDYLGLVLFAAGMTLLLMGISWVRPSPAHFETDRVELWLMTNGS